MATEDRDGMPRSIIKSSMQATRASSPACTALVVAGAVMPFGGLISRPFGIVGAILVLFAFVIAGIEVHHR